MPLINFEINLISTWSENCVISSATRKTKITIADTKLYVPIITIVNKTNIQISWLILNFLIFRGVNKLFVSLFENEDDRKIHTWYYLPKVEIKVHNVMIDGQNFFHHPVESDMRAYESIQKIATGQGVHYTTGCLLDYNYFKNLYKMIAIDLSEQTNTWCWSKRNTTN